jgi:hypothetical protein
MADMYFLSQEDGRILQELLSAYRAGRLNPGAGRVDDSSAEDYLTPETYIAKVPSGGISGVSGGSPGKADADIYRVSTAGALEKISVKAKTLHNVFGAALAENTYTAAFRDKFGKWITIGGGGGSGGTTAGCGLYEPVAGTLAVDAETMVGWGNSGINWTVDNCGFYIEPACGIELGVNGDGEQTIGVKVSDLVGVGLKAGSACTIDADPAAFIVVNAGLVINGDGKIAMQQPSSCYKYVADVECVENVLTPTYKWRKDNSCGAAEEPAECADNMCT